MSIFQMTMVKRIEIYCSNKNFKATGEVYHQRDLRLHLILTYTVFVISELFAMVLSKCHHFIPEPITMDSKTITVLFKRTNDEITAETRRKDKRLLLGFVLRSFEN